MRALTLFAVLASLPALGQWDIEERDEPVQVVEERQHLLSHELFVGLGYLPQDAFYKAVTVQAGYTFHFLPWLGWQVVRGAYCQPVNTGLRRQLERDFGVLATEFETVRARLGSDVVWTPVYGKAALGLSRLSHFQLFFTLGPTGILTDKGVRPAATAGVGFRAFATRRLSVRFDATHDVGLGKKAPQVTTLALSGSFSLGREE